MICVGLTGGIGTGKSTVSRMLKEKSITVIDADVIARTILETHPELISQIKLKFGEEYFTNGNSLDRKKLGNFIFKNSEKRRELEDIMIPKIKEEIFKHIKFCENLKENICVVDAPTLIENGLDSEMDFNLLVWSDLNTQVDRVRKRDGFTLEEAMDRINSQMSMEEKKEKVDFIIDNSLSIENTEKQLDKILDSINEC